MAARQAAVVPTKWGPDRVTLDMRILKGQAFFAGHQAFLAELLKHTRAQSLSQFAFCV